MACARSATCSFAKMLDTWLRTVLRPRNSFRAMVWLLAWAMRSRTYCSRSVSSGKASGGPCAFRAEKYSMTRRAMAGPKMASPEAMASMARAISAFSAALSR